MRFSAGKYFLFFLIVFIKIEILISPCYYPTTAYANYFCELSILHISTMNFCELQALYSPVPLSPAQPISANVHKQWFYNLSDCLRVANPRIKKLQQQAKEPGSFAEPCSATLTNYVKFCSQTVANMNKWYLQTFKILDEDLLYYLSDLEVHLKSAEGSKLFNVLCFAILCAHTTILIG